MHDVIVIGGGVNGLVAGALFARQKLSTLILERRPEAGGAAVTSEIAPGFRVPRLSHALGPMRPDVLRALRLDRAGLEFVRPDPAITTIGRGVLSLHPDVVLTSASINQVSPADAARWREFVQVAARLARLLADIGHAPPPASFSDRGRGGLWQLWQVARQTRGLGPRGLARLARWVTMPMADILAEWFESPLLKAAIAANAIFGNPAGPRSPGTGALWLQRLACDSAPAGSGVTVRGGPGTLAAALQMSALDSGAQLRTDARVVQIVIASGRARGVVLDNGDTIAAGAVVSAVDPRQTLLSLVDPIELEPSIRERARQYRARGVTGKINLALSGTPVFTALHGDAVPMRGRLLIAPDLDYLERAYDAIKYGDLSETPWLEISIPSMVDPTLAPDGQHVMSIYAHFVRASSAKRGDQGDWRSDRRARLYQAALNVLAEHAPNVPSLIVQSDVLTPDDLEDGWGLSGGHIFHGETAIDQTWIARPFLGCSRYRTPIDGLYLAGAGTHPGGGLTGGSGLVAAHAICLDIRTRRRR